MAGLTDFSGKQHDILQKISHSLRSISAIDQVKREEYVRLQEDEMDYLRTAENWIEGLDTLTEEDLTNERVLKNLISQCQSFLEKNTALEKRVTSLTLPSSVAISNSVASLESEYKSLSKEPAQEKQQEVARRITQNLLQAELKRVQELQKTIPKELNFLRETWNEVNARQRAAGKKQIDEYFSLLKSVAQVLKEKNDSLQEMLTAVQPASAAPVDRRPSSVVMFQPAALVLPARPAAGGAAVVEKPSRGPGKGVVA